MNASLLDRDGVLGAVLLADARLLLELGRDVLVWDEAVATVVGVEHLRRQGVAPAVTDAQVGVDPNLHRPAGGVKTSGRYSTARMPTEYLGTSPGLIA